MIKQESYVLELSTSKIITFGSSQIAFIFTTTRNSSNTDFRGAYLIINGNANETPNIITFLNSPNVVLKAGVGGGGSKVTVNNISSTTNCVAHVVFIG